MVAAEPVEHHHGGPAAGRRRALGHEQRGAMGRAVVHQRRETSLRAGEPRRGEAPTPADDEDHQEAAHEVKSVARTIRSPVDPRPVGVFDSGMGGLTVLHECLVTMPHEDFVYLGDHARLPYGPRPLDGDPPLRARDRRLPRGAGREARRRRVQRRDVGRAAAAAGGARRCRSSA